MHGPLPMTSFMQHSVPPAFKVAAILLAALWPPSAAATARPLQTQLKTCSWYSYDKNVSFAGYCTLNDDFIAFNPKQPSTFISQQLTAVFRRNYQCNQLTSEAACKSANSSLQCYWSSREPQCVGTEVTQWKWFSRHPYLSEAPHWLQWMCPGTQAESYKKCSDLSSLVSLNTTACQATEGCALEQDAKTCTAKVLAKSTQSESDKWFEKYISLDAAVVGTCEAVCYLRAAFACSRYYTIKDNAAREAQCRSNRWCNWKDGMCSSNLYGGDAWGGALTSALGVCSGLSKDNSTCLSGSPVVAVEKVNVNTSRSNPPQQLALSKCDY